jgi:regulation of enolase protein 1 (concanavalin A-like superfamily)
MLHKSLLSLLLLLILCGCSREAPETPPDERTLPEGNLLDAQSNENLGAFQWMFEPSTYQLDGGQLRIVAEKETDFFNNPEDGSITASAPLLYREVSGDFVAKAWVRPDFSSMWNAVALMVHVDSTHWIKFAFENSDATGKSIVSVVTRGVSDDANGVVLEDQEAIWLKLIRKDDIYAMHWSLDDETYHMTRLTTLPPTDTVKIGIEAQCPVGPSATHEIRYFGLEQKTMEDLRKGE